MGAVRAWNDVTTPLKRAGGIKTGPAYLLVSYTPLANSRSASIRLATGVDPRARLETWKTTIDPCSQHSSSRLH